MVWMKGGGEIIHCEKSYDEFRFGQVEFEVPVEFSLYYMHLKLNMNLVWT